MEKGEKVGVFMTERISASFCSKEEPEDNKLGVMWISSKAVWEDLVIYLLVV